MSDEPLANLPVFATVIVDAMTTRRTVHGHAAGLLGAV